MKKPEVPLIVEVWIQQLLDPHFLEMINSAPADRIDVKLTGSRGKVSRQPTVVFNGGVQEMIDIL